MQRARARPCICLLFVFAWPTLLAQETACPPEEPTFYTTSSQVADGSFDVVHYSYKENPAFRLTARLRTRFDTEDGAQGWSLSVRHDPEVIEILSATDDGTDGCVLAGCIGGFRKTEPARDEFGVVSGFVSATVLTNFGGLWLPPVGDFSLVDATYRIVPIAPAPGPDSGVLHRESPVAFIDGLQGSGQPVGNVVTYQGATVVPCTETLTVRIRSISNLEFARGDANHDEAVDISDPVTILRSRFHGDATVRCDDGADANDDGTVDISDAIYIFGYLYIGGPEPPAPFPESGPDPTDDELLCQP